MAWTTLTTSSLLTLISQAEYTRYNTTSTSSYYTSDTLVQEVINDTVAEIRSYIAGCPKNVLSANDNEIPASFVQKAKAIVTYKIMERVTGKISDINGSRKDNFDKAYEFLEKVSECKIGVEQPVTASAEITNNNLVYSSEYTQMEY